MPRIDDLRFDDSLETVLAAETSSLFGAQSAWRQLVDLMGRGRVAVNDTAIARLRAIRGDVPPPVRGSSARALASVDAPAALVALFAEDDIPIAAPVLRAAQLTVGEWLALLPGLSPAARSILRHRRDLHPEVVRALDSFGSVDFVLAAPVEAELAAEVSAAAPPERDGHLGTEHAQSFETTASTSPFVSIATIAAGLPVVAEALRRSERDAAASVIEEPPAVAHLARLLAPVSATPVSATPVSATPVPAALVSATPAAPAPTVVPAPTPAAPQAGPFQISELVARIDAFQRRREETPGTPHLEIQPELFAHEPYQAESFRFETDAGGIVRWVEGAARAPLIGLSLHLSALPHGARVDGVAAGAFRRRAVFADARLIVDGYSDAAGQWRIAGIPVFDRVSGRFTGYRGTGRRPRPDETTEPMRDVRNPAADALRQLVHELRTPTNAIAGFAEMIESQMLGPVPTAYRAHAAAIRAQTSDLLTAIEDIDMAARIETHALDLSADDVPVLPLLDRVFDNLTPLAALRGSVLDRSVGDAMLTILGDERAVERLIARLITTLVAASSVGERIAVVATREDSVVSIVVDRPTALAAYAENTLLSIDAEAESERADGNGGAPLLGTGFALRLARNLAAELHGSLTIGDKVLTLRLPAAFSADVEQVSTS